MNLKPEISSSLESSLIKEAVYDPFMNTLTIRFKNGGTYEYIEVPEELYKELIKAPSSGVFFHAKIKNKFQFLRLK